MDWEGIFGVVSFQLKLLCLTRACPNIEKVIFQPSFKHRHRINIQPDFIKTFDIYQISRESFSFYWFEDFTVSRYFIRGNEETSIKNQSVIATPKINRSSLDLLFARLRRNQKLNDHTTGHKDRTPYWHIENIFRLWCCLGNTCIRQNQQYKRQKFK